ncbi:MAG: ABC transporter ATP-binding protein [Lachnospiraceae bacterium]|nr:ABC transporter ATP-binding protein [Lachnospiraceae bacterium]
METVIEFKDFSFKYRAQKEPTLHDINLKICKGEKVLIIGPSGSGKSTLAHCLNGLVPFAFPGDISGDYFVNGKDPRELGIFGLNKMVGTVLQDTDGQFIGLTVAEDIAFALENDMVSQKDMFRRVDMASDQVSVKDLLHHAPQELSGGQKQRVSMAGVMVDDVGIMMFDEPLANLDPRTGTTAIDLIDKIQKNKDATIIIIEHRLEDALFRDVDRIILIGDGTIIADMIPDELLSTDLLAKNGIREPLYLSAIRHAGGIIDPKTHPQHIENMDISPYRDDVRTWFEQVKLDKPKVSDDVVLDIDKIGFSYVPGEKVLDNISFSVHRGEMMSIVGKNGAGKSTLSALICGFIKPDSGVIRLNGSDISSLSIKERGEKIGLGMQNPNQMISKPMIFDEVALGLKVRGIPDEEIKDRVLETLKICGLYEFRNWPISALSFGQKKRVTIASILVMNPEIIILDEPTAGQDYRHYTDIMEFLKMINTDQKITIIMITHDMHLMLEYTNRAVVIADGHMLSDASPADILTDEETAKKAYLKKTSLYDLARKCDIDDPSEFAERFISFERASRKTEQTL